MEAVGKRLGQLMGAEFGIVTNGCAAALCHVTAACIAGNEVEKMRQLPDTTGMKNEVITQPSHRHIYDHAIRMAGAKMVEVKSVAELEAAAGERTAMIAVFGDAVDRGEVPLAELVRVGKKHGIPILVDAAAERPDAPNFYLQAGVDAVAYSGGKCLRGPQASGLLLGRRDLLWTAFMNSAPHHALGRPMKAGKEEIMGLLAAVEMWVKRDHQVEWQEWERRLAVIDKAATSAKGVTTSIRQPGRSNVAPVLFLHWDAAALGLSPEEVQKQLTEGAPRIEVFTHHDGVNFNPYMMEPGEEPKVAQRLGEILAKKG
jgi:seryl-tRNA(Sec) selenium transferase